MVKPGGTLILTVPNFNHAQFFLHSLLDKENLDKHNIKTMTFDFYEAIVKKYNLSITELRYDGGFFSFWTDRKKLSLPEWVLYVILKFFELASKLIPINNKLFSPWLVFVARKSL